MKRAFLFAAVLFVWLFAQALINNYLTRISPLSYPPMTQALFGRWGLQDSVVMLMGFRLLASDLAWIQLLQYTGGEKDPEESRDRPYDFLLPLSFRVVRIDPYNRYARLYSAAFLAWAMKVNRPEEAIQLLAEGLKYDPKYWRYRLYMGAIAYTREGDIHNMIAFMEEALKYPDCPALVKSILANLYKKHGLLDKAVRIWEDILESDAQDMHERAYEQINELRHMQKEALR